MCAFDKVHGDYMYECLIVVMHVYVKQEKLQRDNGGRVKMCFCAFEKVLYVCVRVWSGWSDMAKHTHA